MSDAPQTQLNIDEVLAAYQRRLSALEQDNILKEVTLATVQRESAAKDTELSDLRKALAQAVSDQQAASATPTPVAEPIPAEAPAPVPDSAPTAEAN